MSRPRTKPLHPVLWRLLAAYKLDEKDGLPALAIALGLPYTTVANWQKRGAVPERWLLQAQQDTGRSVGWLKLGRIPDEPQESSPSFFGSSGLKVNEPKSDPVLGELVDQLAKDSSGVTHTPYLGAGGRRRAVEALQAVAAEGEPFAWRKSAEVNVDRPLAEGIDVGGRGALLPVTDIKHVRPLVLSVKTEAGQQLDYQVIPKICGGASAGTFPTRRVESERLVMDQAGEVAFSYEWMRHNLSHTTGDISSVKVLGDSMSPTLLDGDTVLIDRGFSEIKVDAVYVIDMLGQRLVKRVQRKSDGSLVIISDNKAYSREAIPRSRVHEINVIGRVVWPRVR